MLFAPANRTRDKARSPRQRVDWRSKGKTPDSRLWTLDFPRENPPARKGRNQDPRLERCFVLSSTGPRRRKF
jgi:hypothetical protein